MPESEVFKIPIHKIPFMAVCDFVFSVLPLFLWVKIQTSVKE